MGLLARLLGRATPRTAGAIAVHASGLVEVVGESRRQDALRRVAARASGSAAFLDDLSGHALKIATNEPNGRWFRAVLSPEPGNPVDHNAIAVHADAVGMVGYLSRDDAIDYQPIFDALKKRRCTVASCPAFLIGGTKDKPSYGVMLCLSSATRIVQDLDETLPA
jgi:hypothetical protein